MSHPDPLLLFSTGMAAYREKRWEEASAAWEQLLAASPDHLNGLQLLGALHFQRARWQDAEVCFSRVARLRPDLASVWFNLAKAAAAQGRWNEAANFDREGLQRAPDDVGGLNHLGLCLRELGHPGDAARVFERCTQLAPQDAAAWNNLGLALVALGAFEKAAGVFARACEADPASAEAASNEANALRESLRQEEAQSAFERAVGLGPDYEYAWTGLLLNSQYLTDLSRPDRFAWHQRYGRRFEQIPPGAPLADVAVASNRIRIGYVSSELYDHAVAHFLLPILARHDRTRFEVSIFANCTRNDGMTAQLRAAADSWLGIHDLSDEVVVAAIRQQGIHVLVDLNGHSGFSRLGVFARRAAPVQVTYLGYPDTTGLREMDYRITDPIVDPPGPGDACWTEKLWRVESPAWCYRPHAPLPEPGDRRGAGIVFGCFNGIPKVNPAVVAWWSEILHQVSASRLVLKARQLADDAVRERLLGWFDACGIGRERLELRPWARTPVEHLAEYRRVDIALDTFPYHGTTTTCEALWMGVPVITLIGSDHRSRVGASLLAAVSLAEFAAASGPDYVTTAVKLACNPARLRELQAGLRGRMAASPLMDEVRFARKLEDAYEQMLAAANVLR